MKRMLVGVVCCLATVLFATAAFGGSQKCSFAGTWYGGSAGAKYLMTVVPKGGNTYSVTFEGAYSLAGFGVAVNTSFSGEMVKKGPKLYEARVISILTTQSGPPPVSPSSMGIDAARAWVKKTGCMDITSTIDFFGGYIGWGNKEPFVDDPDVDYLGGGGPIVETYRRISMAPMD